MQKISHQNLKKAVDTIFDRYDTDHSGKLQFNEIIPLLQDSANYLGKNFKIDVLDVQQFL